MSLIRQVWLLLLLTLALAFAGAFGLSMLSARQYLATQLAMKNHDSAQSLAQTLAGQHGDLPSMAATLDRQFEIGFYEHLRLRTPQGATLLSREAPPMADGVPDWFVDLLSLHPTQGLAPVVADGVSVGSLEVLGHTRFAYRELWRGMLRTLSAFALLAIALGALAHLLLRRIRVPLEATVRQAQALTERRFITVSEPSVPELRNVTRAMNLMVDRLKAMFDEQAGQVEMLRRQANCDPLTGVSNRPHFMSRLKGLLSSEDGVAGGALLLVRISDLQGLNRRLGRVATDAMLREAGHAIIDSATRVGSFEVGRLNGSDFAMLLPEAASLREPAVDVSARLRSLLRESGRERLGGVSAVVGAVRWWHGAPISSLLAAADQALARAEAKGAFAVELDDTGDGVMLGEDSWRSRIEAALTAERAHLVEFPLIDASRAVLLRECPLRLQLDEAAEPLSGAKWLPMARRTQLTARIDLVAAELALRAIARDGIPRSVNLSPHSLKDSALMPQLRGLLDLHRAASPGLWLEVDEAGAFNELRLLRELVSMAHAHGARVGLEHAGAHIAEPGVLLEAGLDFIKLDASVTEGLAHDDARIQHVASSVRMLHGLDLKVYAEGVADAADADALWQCNIDGITGPAAVPADALAA
ncbi:MAG TPA: EAL domain-containing protein [Ideonella sp.]|uniref:EAL domain-containing protein n=1 Tax=Ideonella sp. TaxID=1929293 RepID=UPI002D0B98E6|nr:EAL domain-containing protein [Ideonella sp.]HSI51600.1 EAL domain-containing protein [Ideonella sp.]